MNHITQNALEIRNEMRNVEALSDDLMSAISALKMKMIAARSHPDVTPHTGQKALIRLHGAEQKLIGSMNDLFRTHDELSALAITMDVEHVVVPTTDADLSRNDRELAKALSDA